MSAKRVLLVVGLLLVGVICLAAVEALDDPLDIDVAYVGPGDYQGVEGTGFKGGEANAGYFVNLCRWDTTNVKYFMLDDQKVEDTTFVYVTTNKDGAKSYSVMAFTKVESISLAGWHSIYWDKNKSGEYESDEDPGVECVNIKTH